MPTVGRVVSRSAQSHRFHVSISVSYHKSFKFNNSRGFRVSYHYDILTALPLDLAEMFLWAPQPELLRATQKDASYVESLQSEVKDISQQMFRQRAVRADAEIDLACSLAYYGATTLAGSRTLGEEFCDILPVAPSLSTAQASRVALIIDQTNPSSSLNLPEPNALLFGPAPPPAPSSSLPPDAGDSSLSPAAAADPAVAEPAPPPTDIPPAPGTLRVAPRTLQLPRSVVLTPMGPLRRGLFVASAVVAPYIAAKFTPAARPVLALPPLPLAARPPSAGSHASAPDADALSASAAAADTVAVASAEPLTARLARLRARASHTVFRSLPARAAHVFRLALFTARQWGPLVSTLHLLAFYLVGAYVTGAHRLAGVRYIALSRPTHRLRFTVLAWLMLLRLAVAAGRRAVAARARAHRHAAWLVERRARAHEKQVAAVELRRLNFRMQQRWAQQLARARAMQRGEAPPEAQTPPSTDAGVGVGGDAADVPATAATLSATLTQAAYADLVDLEPFLSQVDAEAEAAGGPEALAATNPPPSSHIGGSSGGQAGAGTDPGTGAGTGQGAAAARGQEEDGPIVGGYRYGQLVLCAHSHPAGAHDRALPPRSPTDTGAERETDERPTGTCSICMDERTDTTATECGHLFCWGCIAQATWREPRCPLCRAEARPERLLRLFQYR
jgi:hypothetical protein